MLMMNFAIIIEFMHNFNINIPSIPSKRILFKIQNNKTKGFQTRQGRFKDNMSYLSKHFINSFPNLHPSSPPKNNKDDQNDSNVSTKMSSNHSSSFCRANDSYRMMVDDNKKNLMLKYEEHYRHYQPKLDKDFSIHKGYTFGKSQMNDTLDQQLKKYPSQKLERNSGTSKIIDNYYFNTEQSQEDDQIEKIELEKRREEKLAKKNVIRKSAVFESEDRWKSLERQLQSKIKVGPGTYAVTEEKKKIPKKREKVTMPIMKLEKVMEILQEKFQPNPQQEEPKRIKLPLGKEASGVKKSSMFMKGNTDRFGQQIFPINPPLNVPGPGAYKYEDSLEDKANRILVLEQQRKLLKQWYNN